MPVSDSHSLSSRDLWLLALLTLTWGVNWPVMKIGVAQLEPMTFRALCALFAIPVLYLSARARGVQVSVARRYWRELALIGLTSMVGWFVFGMYGVKLLSAGRAVTLGFTMPIFTALIGFAIYDDRPSARLWLGVVAAALGVAMLLVGEFRAMAGSPVGTLLMLAAAFSWGLGTQLMRRRRQPTSVVVITFWSMLATLLVSGTLALAFEREGWTRFPTRDESLAIAYNAVVISGFSQLVWFRLATILPPVVSSLSVMMIPVIGVFSGMWMLGEQPAWRDFAALASILIAMVAVLRPARRLG